jgi:hypothetical protein
LPLPSQQPGPMLINGQQQQPQFPQRPPPPRQ